MCGTGTAGCRPDRGCGFFRSWSVPAVVYGNTSLARWKRRSWPRSWRQDGIWQRLATLRACGIWSSKNEAPRIQAAAWESLRRVVETMQASPDASKIGYLATMQRILRRRDKDPRDDRLFFGAPVILLVLSPSVTDGSLAAASIELMTHASGLGAAVLWVCADRYCPQRGALPRTGNCARAAAGLPTAGIPGREFLRTPPRKAAQVRWM